MVWEIWSKWGKILGQGDISRIITRITEQDVHFSLFVFYKNFSEINDKIIGQ